MARTSGGMIGAEQAAMAPNDGGLRWSRSSVKNLLDRARDQGMVRKPESA